MTAEEPQTTGRTEVSQKDEQILLDIYRYKNNNRFRIHPPGHFLQRRLLPAPPAAGHSRRGDPRAPRPPHPRRLGPGAAGRGARHKPPGRLSPRLRPLPSLQHLLLQDVHGRRPHRRRPRPGAAAGPAGHVRAVKNVLEIVLTSFRSSRCLCQLLCQESQYIPPSTLYCSIFD